MPKAGPQNSKRASSPTHRMAQQWAPFDSCTSPVWKDARLQLKNPPPTSTTNSEAALCRLPATPVVCDDGQLQLQPQTKTAQISWPGVRQPKRPTRVRRTQQAIQRGNQPSPLELYGKPNSPDQSQSKGVAGIVILPTPRARSAGVPVRDVHQT